MSSPIANAYSVEAANQIGGDLPFFIGKQHGSGWLGTIARFAFPLIKRFVGAAGNVAEDMIYKKKPFGASVKRNAMKEIHKLASDIARPGSNKPANINRQTAPRKKKTSYPLFNEGKRKRRRRN